MMDEDDHSKQRTHDADSSALYDNSVSQQQHQQQQGRAEYHSNSSNASGNSNDQQKHRFQYNNNYGDRERYGYQSNRGYPPSSSSYNHYQQPYQRRDDNIDDKYNRDTRRRGRSRDYQRSNDSNYGSHSRKPYHHQRQPHGATSSTSGSSSGPGRRRRSRSRERYRDSSYHQNNRRYMSSSAVTDASMVPSNSSDNNNNNNNNMNVTTTSAGDMMENKITIQSRWICPTIETIENIMNQEQQQQQQHGNKDGSEIMLVELSKIEAYIKNWRIEKAREFVKLHLHEEWFKSKYVYQQWEKNHQDLIKGTKHIANVYSRLILDCQTSDDLREEDVIPVLEILPDFLTNPPLRPIAAHTAFQYGAIKFPSIPPQISITNLLSCVQDIYKEAHDQGNVRMYPCEVSPNSIINDVFDRQGCAGFPNRQGAEFVASRETVRVPITTDQQHETDETNETNDKLKVSIQMEFIPQVSNGIVPLAASNIQRLTHDFHQAVALSEALDRVMGIVEIENDPLMNGVQRYVGNGIRSLLDNQDLMQKLGTLSRQFDLVLCWLRNVHLVEYYAGKRYPDIGTMISNYPAPHLRHPIHNSLDVATPEDVLFLQELDISIREQISHLSIEKEARREKDRIRIRDMINQLQTKSENGSEYTTLTIDRYVMNNICRFEEGEKCRCLVHRCFKLFENDEYLRKHFHSCHAESLLKSKNPLRIQQLSQAHNQVMSEDITAEILMNDSEHPIVSSSQQMLNKLSLLVQTRNIPLPPMATAVAAGATISAASSAISSSISMAPNKPMQLLRPPDQSTKRKIREKVDYSDIA